MKAKNKKIAAVIAGVLVLAIGGLLIAAAMKPDYFKVERSAVINAPVDKVFAQVNDLHNFNNWSPWAKLDPNSVVTYGGSQIGNESWMSWDGNMDVGKGKMTIVESVPNQVVKMRLDFEKPMAGTSTAEFRFTPAGNDTNVSWGMYGENSFPAKIMSVIMDCEKMMGGYFEEGLNNLNKVVQGQ